MHLFQDDGLTRLDVSSPATAVFQELLAALSASSESLVRLERLDQPSSVLGQLLTALELDRLLGADAVEKTSLLGILDGCDAWAGCTRCR